jgi:homospermidine synthase
MTAFTGLLAFGAVSTAFVPVWATGLGAALGVVAIASWALNPPRHGIKIS